MLGDVPLTLVGLVGVVVVVRTGGALAVRAGEPRIAGEMIAAILIGPTLLGGQIEGIVAGAPGTGIVGAVFPTLAVDVLTSIGAVGLILFMLLVGVTIDPLLLARRAGTILGLSLSVVVAMGVLAIGVAAWLRSQGGWQGAEGTSRAFTLAVAAALAAHGVPIAARILEERGLLRTEVGAFIIAAGACTTALALALSALATGGADSSALAQLALVFAAGAVIVAVAAPLGRSRRMRLAPMPAVFVLLAIALAAGGAGRLLLGTVLLGPLIVGIVVRTAGWSAVYLEARLGAFVRGLLLPVFLAGAALHTNLRELGSTTLAPVLTLLVTVVVVKLVAAFVTARLAGFDRDQSRAIGALLQCGGIVTIAVSLEVLQAGIITTRTHAMMTLVGLVTTMLAGPLLTASRVRFAEGPPRPDPPVAHASAVP